MRSSDSLDEERMNRENDQRSPERVAEDRASWDRTPDYLREPKRERVWIDDNDPDSDDPS